MIEKVEKRVGDFNNNSTIAKNPVLSQLKLVYYKVFAILYKLVGTSANVIMVNSTWTSRHIVNLWNVPSRTRIVYPPCDTTEMTKMPISSSSSSSSSSGGGAEGTNRESIILSIAQYRPEKAHSLQLKSLAKLFKNHPDLKNLQGSSKITLVCIGSSRNEEDAARAQALRDLAVSLNIQDHVKIVENAKYSELLDYLRRSSVGIHTMTDEHFGIGIIEYMVKKNKRG